MPKKVIFTHHPDITQAPAGEEEEHHIMTSDQIIHSWQSAEYHQHSRQPHWFLFGAIGAGLLLLYSIFTANFLFAIIIVMCAVIINMYARREPQKVQLAITKHGFKVNNKLYTYEDDLGSFWILYKPPYLKTINLGRKQKLFPALVFQLEEENPLKIRELLLDHLPEDTEKEEHWADKMARQMKV